MKIFINGEDREFTSVASLSDLIAQLGMKPDRVAVELNRDLVPRDRWPTTMLSDGDKLEIVHFVGGGCSDANSRLNSRGLYESRSTDG
jgi:thiamine biosynthesis protein ThiS